MATNRDAAMVADVPPFPDHERDALLIALEGNALARWWRARAGAAGETGARVIARDRPARPPEPPEPPASTRGPYPA